MKIPDIYSSFIKRFLFFLIYMYPIIESAFWYSGISKYVRC